MLWWHWTILGGISGETVSADRVYTESEFQMSGAAMVKDRAAKEVGSFAWKLGFLWSWISFMCCFLVVLCTFICFFCWYWPNHQLGRLSLRTFVCFFADTGQTISSEDCFWNDLYSIEYVEQYIVKSLLHFAIMVVLSSWCKLINSLHL